MSKLNDSEAEAAEAQTWIEFAVQCGYMDRQFGRELFKVYDEIIAMLLSIANNPTSWIMPSGQKIRGRR